MCKTVVYFQYCLGDFQLIENPSQVYLKMGLSTVRHQYYFESFSLDFDSATSVTWLDAFARQIRGFPLSQSSRLRKNALF